jgi:dTDP-4-amino-4,6-dideoxygalactose transaminase
MSRELVLTDPDLGPEEIAAVTCVLQGKWLTSGPVTAEFETEFGKKMRAPHAVAVGSCTAALHLANLVLGIGPGAEVICPDLTFIATANAVRYTGDDVVFEGTVSEDDLTISPAQIEERITARTRAICVVHYAGYACRMEEIMALAECHGLQVIEDCAHAPFARHRQADGSLVSVGTLGAVGCFSFFGNKNMTTGEGGMVTTGDDLLAAELRSLRSHALSRPTHERHLSKELGYEIEALGYNYRFDEIRAAIGLCQLKKIDRLNEQRRGLVAAYRRALADISYVQVPFLERDLALSSCHIMPVLIDGDVTRVRTVLREHGIHTSKHYEPVGNYPMYRTRSPSPSTKLAARLVTLPLGPHMSEEDVFYVAAKLQGEG